MNKLHHSVYFERTDRAKNMARFYLMSIQPTLFDEVSLHRNWGRIGTRGSDLVQFFDHENDAIAAFVQVVRKKRAKGYRQASQHPIIGEGEKR
jgi:predicted DNA-binding WGR domain protein